MSELTFADLRVHYGTGRAYTISGKGRDRVMGYRSGMMCDLGDIEESEWCEMVRNLIVQTGEQELHQQLITHMKEHYRWKRSKAEFEKQALELHASRIFDNPQWVDFIIFNKRFRPEVLRTARLIWVKNTCCKKAGQVTQAMLETKGSQGKVCCPHCGRWSEYEIMTTLEKEDVTNE